MAAAGGTHYACFTKLLQRNNAHQLVSPSATFISAHGLLSEHVLSFAVSELGCYAVRARFTI